MDGWIDITRGIDVNGSIDRGGLIKETDFRILSRPTLKSWCMYVHLGLVFTINRGGLSR